MKILQKRAFTLIEVIVTLAVIAALATAILVPFIKHLDRLASEKESRRLRDFAQAFKKRIEVTKVIPSNTGWAQAVAAQLGLEVTSVTKNDRGLPRIFLIDPNLMIGENLNYVLPYTQGVTGSTITKIQAGRTNVVAPVSPRLMIISSLSTPLPSTLLSGVGAANGINAFTNIWETPEGKAPPGWTFAKGDDLKVQRMDLSDLFMQVILNNEDKGTNAPFKIVGAGQTFIPASTSWTMYFIRGTEMQLQNVNTNIDYSEVIQTSASFMFDLGTWQSEPFLGRGVSQPGALDLQRAMNFFLSTDHNSTANGGATQLEVYKQMIRYMSNFVAWRNAGYPTINSSSELYKSQAALSTITINMIDPR